MRRFVLMLSTIILALGTMTGCSSKKNNNDTLDEAKASVSEQQKDKNNYGAFKANPENGVIDISQIGVKIQLPDGLKNKQDKIAVSGFVDETMGDATIYMIDKDDDKNKDFPITFIVCEAKPIDRSGYIREESGITDNVLFDMGSNGNAYYMGYMVDKMHANGAKCIEDVTNKMTEDKKKEYIELLSYSTQLIENAVIEKSFSLPSPPSPDDYDSNKLMSMSVDDIDKNHVKISDFISFNKVTMINFWGTFCGPCIKEMPILAELDKKYKEQGFGILGVVADSDIIDENGNHDEDLIKDAKTIIADSSVEYPNLVCSSELRKYANIQAYPTTFFVDSSGKMLMSPIVGSRDTEEWEKFITEAFELINQSSN